MSLLGKGASSIRRKDVLEQRSVALGFKKLKFAHKATLGDTIIDLTALVTPTEMSTYGFVNPTAAAIAAVNINVFRNNLKLVSSIRGLLIDQLSYSINSASKITLIGFTAEDGEIFVGHMDEAPATQLTAVDGRNIVASGILLAGNTDFNIGTPIEINKYPGQNVGAVMVFADRGLQYRKAGNAASGDGDYYEVPVAGGLGSIIRFPASGSDRFIQVVSNGIVAERPDGSMTAMIERAQGQIDAMVPTVAALAGVPTTNFQTAPNSVDLKQFGDQVITNTTNITSVGTRVTALENATVPFLEVRKSTTQTVPNASTTNYILFNVVVEDNKGTYNTLTGEYTVAPGEGGLYQIECASTPTTGQAWTTGQEWSHLLMKNGNYVSRVGSTYAPTNHSQFVYTHGAITKRFAAGDKISVALFHGRGANTDIYNDSNLVYMTITKVGK